MGNRPRKSRVSELIRGARATLGFDQSDLAERARVSTRMVCRWETDEAPPTPEQAKHLLAALSGASPSVVAELAELLGMPLAPPPPEKPPVTPEAARAALDAVVHATCEAHDLVPRDIRAFAVALLGEIDRLGLKPSEAAGFVAPLPRLPPKTRR